MKENTVAILVHGYHVINPEETVGKFRQYFEAEGCMVENFTYGYVPFTWQITRRNPALAKKLAKRCRYWWLKGYRVIIVNHSNGATITYLTSVRHYSQVWRVLSMHPALGKEYPPYRTADKVIVVHNQGDKAVVIGSWLSRIVKRLTPRRYHARPWGQMGQDGYKGLNKNVTNIDTGDEQMFNSITAHGHSDEFSDGKYQSFLPLFVKMILEE